MPNWATQDMVFATTCTTISDFKGISSQDAIQNLFEFYTYLVSFFDTALILASYNSTFFKALG